MKTAISVPDDTFEAVEQAAARLGISRSQFFARAAQRWVEELEDADLTTRINTSLSGVDQGEDLAFIREAATRVLRDDEG